MWAPKKKEATSKKIYVVNVNIFAMTLMQVGNSKIPPDTYIQPHKMHLKNLFKKLVQTR